MRQAGATARPADLPGAPSARAADHRERLMAGLAEAIREKGLARTQITDIVGHAHASRTTFYRCFADKEACFFALAQRLTDATREAVEAAVDPEAPWSDQVDQAIDAYIDILSVDPEIVVTFVSDLPVLGERAARLRREGIAQYAEMLVRLASTPRMREAEIAVDGDTAVLIMSGLDGMFVHAVEAGRSLAELAPAAKDAVKRVLARAEP